MAMDISSDEVVVDVDFVTGLLLRGGRTISVGVDTLFKSPGRLVMGEDVPLAAGSMYHFVDEEGANVAVFAEEVVGFVYTV